MRQLLPFPCDPVDPAVLYGDLPSVRTRPAVRLNMIASIDGATAVTPPIVVTVAEAPAHERKKAADLADVVIAGERDVDLGPRSGNWLDADTPACSRRAAPA